MKSLDTFDTWYSYFYNWIVFFTLQSRISFAVLYSKKILQYLRHSKIHRYSSIVPPLREIICKLAELSPSSGTISMQEVWCTRPSFPRILFFISFDSATFLMIFRSHLKTCWCLISTFRISCVPDCFSTKEFQFHNCFPFIFFFKENRSLLNFLKILPVKTLTCASDLVSFACNFFFLIFFLSDRIKINFQCKFLPPFSNNFCFSLLVLLNYYNYCNWMKKVENKM